LRNNVRNPSRPSGRSGGSKGTKSGSVNTHLTNWSFQLGSILSELSSYNVRYWHKLTFLLNR
jgi:hypothetical protein